MNRRSLGLCCALLLACGVAHAAKVKLSLPAGTYSARFLYESEAERDSVSPTEAAKSGASLAIPGDARANVVVMVTDDTAGNAARVDLGLPPKSDVDIKLAAKDFLWVETVEVRVIGQPDLQPVSGALVLVRREGKPETAWVGETTADGVARVGPVPSGNLSVDVYTQDGGTASQFFTVERERPGKMASVEVPLAAAATPAAPGGPEAPAGTPQPAAPAAPSAAPLPMKVLVGLLGLVSLAFFAKLWVFLQAQERASDAPLGPSRGDKPFGGMLIGPAIVVALISGLAAAISASQTGGAEGATAYLLCMLAQAGFALVALTGIRGRNDALAGFGASALTASFLAPLALAQTWIPGADGTRLLALILNVVGASIGLAVLIAAVAALDRLQGVPSAAPIAERPGPEPALCPYCGEPIDAATGACACERPAPVATAPQAIAGEPVLMSVRGRYAGVEFTIRADGPTRIGRDPASDIVVDDPTVSRRHAEVERDADGIVLTDLGSSNGTFVNGARVDRVALSPGDEIAVGGSAFRLQVTG